MLQEKNKELVMFYNVENLFSPDNKPKHKLDPTISGHRNWDERKYNNKLFKIAHVFQLIQEEYGVLPIIIGLSEIYSDQNLQDLIKLAPFNNNFGIVHYDSLDERGVDTALLYDKSKIELLESEAIGFVFEQEENKTEYTDTTRDVLFCKLKYQEETINVFVLHLPSKREQDINKPKRDYILKSIKQRIFNLSENLHQAVIICGDFNEDPNAENINNLLYDEGIDKVLHNPFVELYNQKKFSTFHHQQGLLFDQILLSSHFLLPISTLEFNKAAVFNHQKLSNWDKKFSGRPFRTYAGTRYLGGYSDHYPVLVELKINLF